MLKGLIDGVFTALSLYSVIPVPRTEWTPRGIRYALCFLPLVGLVIGVLSLLWFELARYLDMAASLFAAVAALLPVAVSGGVHMGGFINTSDAIASHGLREQKLEILKDAHVSAFGVLFCGGWLLLSYGLWQQLYQRPRCLTIVALGYVASRCLAALFIVTVPPARRSGLARLLSDASAKKAVLVSCGVLLAGTLGLCVTVSPLWGGIAALSAAGNFLLHRRWCLWEFGGNTGDLTGFLLQNVELLLLAVAAVGGLMG